jgi:hypothetical protein
MNFQRFGVPTGHGYISKISHLQHICHVTISAPEDLFEDDVDNKKDIMKDIEDKMLLTIGISEGNYFVEYAIRIQTNKHFNISRKT